MADDMVAELTLRLQNEMSGGIEAIEGDFDSLQGVLGGLRDVLGELTAQLQAMTAPVALEEGMAGVATGADEALQSVTGIGVALDADITKAGELGAVLSQAAAGGSGGAAVIPGAGGGGGVGDDGEAGDTGMGRRKQADGGGSHGWLVDGFLGLIGVTEAEKGERSYAEFQSTAMQAAIVEGYTGKAALHEAHKIMHESYNQAYLSRGNVDDIERAYLYLVKQQMPQGVAGSIMGPLTEGATTYDAPVDELTNTVYHLYDQLKIPANQMSQAISIMGAATHLGLFSFSDFAEGLPSVGTQFAKLGFGGLPGEAVAAAALESVRAGTPDASHAYTDLTDLLNYMTSGTAVRFFDRTKRSQDLLGKPIMDLLDKYHIKPLDLPEYFNAERDKGVDPLDAMVDYMHDIGASKMSPTDQAFLFNSLFHNQEAGTAMLALEQNYDKFQHDKLFLGGIGPGFLDDKFQTAILGDAAGLQNMDTEGTYLSRWWGQNTLGWFTGANGPSQATADAAYPGSSAFNIPINLTVNVDKSGSVTATAVPGFAPGPAPPGVNLRVHQGNVLDRP